ncbi:hypothetical protein NW768_004729 [Fusarium equiseti]|uniref:Peptidase S33 tripeptidyl aminopeptidase-like C-terminal domain-containing protein n=1 Tax=Fusarium equiseti TaxID=61235 RepID=A0ABQ8RH05_FUSEQ|nr:hypothetical protein NW768_004729 [Fusarium equiseti]
MKVQSFLLGNALLHSTQGLSLPDDVHAALTTRTNSKKSSIEWSECNLDFGTKKLNEAQKAFDCARLEVPLDYANSDNGKTIKLDLIRAKATKKPSKGSILFNPGGPGPSGVESLLTSGSDLLFASGGQHDIIAFDTRGTGRTLTFNCSAIAGQDESDLRRREFNTLPQVDLWDVIRGENWDSTGAQAQSCFDNNKDIGKYIGTPYIARDMMSIVDALGQGEKLNYWGISYGSILGQVVASMFPKRMGRILLDSNPKVDDYAAATWLSSVRDTERSIVNLFDDCVESGEELCSLANYHGKNTTGESLMNTFKDQLGIWTNRANSKENATESELVALALIKFKNLVLQELYNPINYPNLASRIEGLFKNNETAMLKPGGLNLESKWNPFVDQANNAIACGDSSFRAEVPDDLFSMYQALLAEASWGDTQMIGRFRCARWKFSAAEQIDLDKIRSVNTSYPVLVINGRYDPVTPLSGSWEVSAQFRRSRLVVHKGVGHGVINHSSNCTNAIIAEYFIDGKMPKLNTTCSPDMTAFEYADTLNNLIKQSEEKEAGDDE